MGDDGRFKGDDRPSVGERRRHLRADLQEFRKGHVRSGPWPFRPYRGCAANLVKGPANSWLPKSCPTPVLVIGSPLIATTLPGHSLKIMVSGPDRPPDRIARRRRHRAAPKGSGILACRLALAQPLHQSFPSRRTLTPAAVQLFA
jgi:hypothetical protein